MTPAEVIRRLFPSAKWGNPEWQAVKDVLAEEGLVVVSVEDQEDSPAYKAVSGRAERAEAKVSVVRMMARQWADDPVLADAGRALLAALDDTQETT